MKMLFISLVIALPAMAADLKLKDYDWMLSDVAQRGLSKEKLFSRMDRDFIRTNDSICSNRALMWVHNFKESYDIDSGKIFLFYTKKKGDISLKPWWYHVAPVINENGNVWVMDAGFPGGINRPMSAIEWLSRFADSSNCKEINASETDLVELIFKAQTFPRQTRYGTHDCYYKIVPHTIWTPEVLAMNLLGRDSDGRPARTDRDIIDREELYQACLEATTSKIGYALGTNKKECKEYAGL